MGHPKVMLRADAALILGFTALGMAVGVLVTQDHAPTPLPACVSDDGATDRPCLWDAQRQGNGEGTSFVALPDGTIIPLTSQK